MDIPITTMKGKYVAIDADDSSCHGYYVINFSSSAYILQSNFSIDGQVVDSGEMVCENRSVRIVR